MTPIANIGLATGLTLVYTNTWPRGRGDSLLEKDMGKFKVGDVVKRKDGKPFGDGNLFNTIRESKLSETFQSPNIVWVANGWIGANQVELVLESPEDEDAKVGSYYNFPFKDWFTVNDMLDYMSQKQWGWRSYIFKDIVKACFRFGQKEGTTEVYDAEKIIYYGTRLLMSVSDKATARKYLQQLLDDKQFKEDGE